MRSCKTLCAPFAAAVLTVFAAAQAGGVAHIQAPALVKAKAHSQATAEFTVAVQSGFHIQSNHPKLEYLIPSSITLTPAKNVSLAKVVWPAAQEHKFGFSADPLAVFAGTVKVEATLATGAPGKATLHGTFRYQACN